MKIPPSSLILQQYKYLKTFRIHYAILLFNFFAMLYAEYNHTDASNLIYIYQWFVLPR